ncbi:JmjC domain-containing protein [Fodinicola acaciae]|uniref:JmjC domain-containing protein n=1 Tax=Fodinicola acaciae TaxID=2681555 RepID=UPI0013CFCFA2|nr:cupin domain-containing protein [Fodinicola acaciae]
MSDIAELDTLDWDVFVERFWDRRPVLVRHLPWAPFQEDEVYQAAVRATAELEPGLIPPNAQFTVERRQQVSRGDLLPEGADASLAGYQKRVAERLGGRRYALVVHGFHGFCFPQWKRERDFYAGLWQRVGLPLSGAITTLFHGTYEHSPVGVHKDRFATFMFGLSGRKRMRFWPSRPWTAPVSTVLDYQPYVADSFAAEVGPGELLYWPSSYFHVGESAGDTAATSVNIGVPREGHRAAYDLDDLLLNADPALLADPGLGFRQFDAPAGASTAITEPAGLAPAMADALRHFRQLADHQLARRTADRSLRIRTAGGFRPVPPPAPRVPLTDGTVVRPVEEIAIAGGLCAANGQVTSFGARLRPLLDRLRDGQPVTADGEAGRALLETLESFRAVRRDV